MTMKIPEMRILDRAKIKNQKRWMLIQKRLVKFVWERMNLGFQSTKEIGSSNHVNAKGQWAMFTSNVSKVG